MQKNTTQLLPAIAIVLIINPFFSTNLIAQTSQGFHVNNFKEILGNAEEEDQLLTFAQQHGFNYLLLYNLNYIHKNLYDLSAPKSSQVLATFIAKAKTQYAIREIGVVGEKAASFDWAQDYQALYQGKPNKRIDVYHLEFEFWNKTMIDNYYYPIYLIDIGYKNSVDAAFDFYLDELQNIKTMTRAQGIKCETYIGNTTDIQCEAIGRICDRVLVHYYRKSDIYNNGNSIYQYRDERIPALVRSGKKIAILPLFSAGERFMGPWLVQHPPEQAFDTYLMGQEGYSEQSGDWKALITMEGFHWYRYSDLKFYSMPTSTEGLQSTVEFMFQKIDPLAPPIPFGDGQHQRGIVPNPANTEISIAHLQGELIKLEVYTQNGLLFDEFNPQDFQNNKLDVSNWPNGLFYIQSTIRKTSQATQSLLVRHK